jgi:3'-phosphoadenosine 5'-phosphosulfate sulfotransferase (PAPS reductase)/FAD synthetase
MNPVLSTPELDALLARGAPVAIGVSGGKDSSAAAAQVLAYLDCMGHPKTQRLLIHADLGLIEWADSARVCTDLAAHLGVPLVTVRRSAGDMIDRWRQRWRNVSDRYRQLEAVAVILPFSTPSMRFCTSEMKSAVIASELRRRFPGQTIISATGLRRAESHARAMTPILKANPRLFGKRAGTSGYDWAPIADFSLEDVWQTHAEHRLPVHEAYRVWGSSRVSCSFCIMSSAPDLAAAFSHPGNREAWSALSELEIESAFSFQSGKWLSDLGLAAADDSFRRRLAAAKAIAAARHAAEARLSRDLLYVAGWPTFVPDLTQSELIAGVRREVCGLYGWDSPYLSAATVQARYAELFAKRPRLPDRAEEPDRPLSLVA